MTHPLGPWGTHRSFPCRLAEVPYAAWPSPAAYVALGFAQRGLPSEWPSPAKRFKCGLTFELVFD